MLGLKRGTVKLFKHSPNWQASFDKEKKLIKETLGDIAIDIQHIGSTSIPGIIAKPIIDIEVGIKGLDNLHRIEGIAKILDGVGYKWIRESSNPDNHVFVKGSEEKRTHYLHLVEYEGKVWKNDLFFRDALKKNPKLAKEYEQLKVHLAEQYPEDREKYTKNKEVFFREILKRRI